MNKKRILIIDDEQDFLMMAEKNLKQTQKYEVLALSNAKDIITHVHAFKPDVILLDMIMPDVGGIEACDMLNKDPIGIKTPIIIISALDKDKDKLKAYKLGVVDYLTKPADISMIISVIEKALRFK